MKTPQPGRFSFGERMGLGVALLLLVAAWLMPLHFLPWVSWHNEVPVFAAVYGLSAWAVCRLTRRGRIALPSAMLMFGGLALLVLWQVAMGMITFAGDALVLTLYLVLSALSWVLGFAVTTRAQAGPSGRLFIDASEALGLLAKLLLLGALVSVLLALIQVFDVWESAGWVVRMPQLRRPGANLAQPNHLATMLLMGLASLLYLYEARRLSGWGAGLMFGALALGLAASESRTGLLNFFLLSVWWLVGHCRAGFRLRAAAMAVAGLAVLCLFWLWPVMMAAISYFEPGATVNTGDSLRLLVWSQLLEAVWQRPWLGWGLREVSEAHNAVVHAHSMSAPFTYAHNIVLDMAIGMGIPLTLLLLGLSAIWLWRRLRAVRELPTWYCVAAVLPLAMHSMLEFPFAYAYFLAPAMFLLGVLDGATGGKSIAPIGVKPVAAVLLAVGAVGAWSVVEYFRIEEDFRIVRFEALRLGKTPEDYERPQIFLLTQLGALLEGGRIVPAPGMTPERLELARRVALRYPWPATQHRYALSLALNGQSEEAQRQLLVIRALHGAKTYTEIKSNWEAWSRDKYPQLRTVRLP